MKKVFIIMVLFFGMCGNLAWGFSAGDEEKDYQGIKYACTGVGESKEDPRWKDYPLKLMFTTGGHAYVSYVDVKVMDSNGKMVFTADCDAPWLLIKLPKGKYEVVATALKKYQKQATVNVSGTGQTIRAIRFEEISGEM